MKKSAYVLIAGLTAVVAALVPALPAQASQPHGISGDKTEGAVSANGQVEAPVRVRPAIQPFSHGFCNNWRRFDLSATEYIRQPSIGTTGTTHCIMNQGAQSNGVLALQNALVFCYGRNIARDGIFGRQTRLALEYAQGQEQITVDGVYGPQTRDAIFWPIFNTGGVWTGFCIT